MPRHVMISLLAAALGIAAPAGAQEEDPSPAEVGQVAASAAPQSERGPDANAARADEPPPADSAEPRPAAGEPEAAASPTPAAEGTGDAQEQPVSFQPEARPEAPGTAPGTAAAPSDVPGAETVPPPVGATETQEQRATPEAEAEPPISTAAPSAAKAGALPPHQGPAAGDRRARSGRRATLWTLAGVLSAGAAAGGYALTSHTLLNAPPVIGSLNIQPQKALVSVTEVKLAPQGERDPEGHALSFVWDFGDGTGAVTREATHIYQKPGTYTVRLEVSDGRHVTRATSTVECDSLTATWSGTLGGDSVPFSLTLVQTGSALSGVFSHHGRNATLSFGKAVSPRNVTFTIPHDSHTRLFQCDLTEDLNRCVGSHVPPLASLEMVRR